jgi:molybdate transport system substrate-binding protein
MDYPRRLVSAHLADADSLYRYAVGRLVLWAPAGSRIDVAKLGMNTVLDPAVQKIAMANPRTAPYGRAAEQALRHFKLYDKIASKLVIGENVRQTEQFAESGNVQLAFLPLAFTFPAEQKDKGSYFEVPLDSYGAIDQGAVVLSKSKDKALAEEFLAFLRRPDTVLLLRRYGFIEAKTLGRER